LSVPSLKPGDFPIDLSRRAVKVRGNELQLASAEFEILVFLTSHRKSVVPVRCWQPAGRERKCGRPSLFVCCCHCVRSSIWRLVQHHPTFDRGSSTVSIRVSPTSFEYGRSIPQCLWVLYELFRRNLCSVVFNENGSCKIILRTRQAYSRASRWRRRATT